MMYEMNKEKLLQIQQVVGNQKEGNHKSFIIIKDLKFKEFKKFK